MNQDTEFKEILRAVSLITGISEELIKSKTRKQDIKDARFLFFFYCKKNTIYFYKQISGYLNRHHSTAINGVKKFRDLSNNEDKLMNQYLRLCNVLDPEILKNDCSKELAQNLEILKQIENQL
jgi:chromosomal replication initiation ATPase DnaA